MRLFCHLAIKEELRLLERPYPTQDSLRPSILRVATHEQEE